MKKNSKNFLLALTGLFVTVSTIAASEYRFSQAQAMKSYAINAQSSSEEKSEDLPAEESSMVSENGSSDTTASGEASTEQTALASKDDETTQSKEIASSPTVVQAPRKSTVLSRGGKEPTGDTTSKKAKTETLDWWKEARYVFAIGNVATVKDLYTGKTFKVKRTMGTNHADTEALTTEDTNTIKSIWGGFSWDRRPIHIYINGRVLAASMSAMPHAGIDSAPAFAYVKNRSEGYGSGDNLDVVKGNSMDGHFDIHFLNSTRHKDGDVDPQHQSMIKIASQR